MVDPFLAAAVSLLVLGVVGSVAPLLPGGLLSLAGVSLYWWSTGYAEPALPILAGFVAVGLFAVAVDWLGGAIAAGAGGASVLTSAAAGAVGIVLLLSTGPLIALLGVAATVFLLELRRQGDARAGLRTALFATAGMLGSAAVQVLLTGTMLVAFLVVVVL